jgi:hypothetical protein
VAGAAERKLDHMGFARDDAELAAQRRQQRSVPLPRICRQPAARPGETGIPRGGEQVLNRNWQSLEGTDGHPSGKGSIGGRGDGARLLRRPQRIGVQPLAKALVTGNCRLDQLPSGHPLLTQIACDLDQCTGEQIARHRHLP